MAFIFVMDDRIKSEVMSDLLIKYLGGHGRSFDFSSDLSLQCS